MFEDDPPAPKPARLPKLLLDPLGLAELEGYIAELKAEIARVEGEIDRKGRQRSIADSVFRRT